MKKVLLISEFTPPLIEGVSILLGNLLRFFPKKSYSIFTDDHRKRHRVIDPHNTLDCHYYYFRLPEYYGKNLKILSLVIFSHFLLIPLIVLKGIKIIRKEKIDKLLAPNNNGAFFISAFLIHKILKIPLYVYLFDLYKLIHLSRIRRFFANLFEEKILRSASHIFVMSESLQDFYYKEYKITTDFMPQPAIFLNLSAEKYYRISKNNYYKIVFMGTIHNAIKDSLLNMVNVANSLDNVRLFIYIPRPKEKLKQIGFEGRNTVCRVALRDEISMILREADILFLPMAFQTNYDRRIIETASPSKLADYIVAGKPILIHAPEYSYISQYARKYNFALVVDEPDINKLREATLQLLHNSELKNNIVNNAKKVAKVHDARLVSKKIQDYLLFA